MERTAAFLAETIIAKTFADYCDSQGLCSKEHGILATEEDIIEDLWCEFVAAAFLGEDSIGTEFDLTESRLPLARMFERVLLKIRESHGRDRGIAV